MGLELVHLDVELVELNPHRVALLLLLKDLEGPLTLFLLIFELPVLE